MRQESIKYFTDKEEEFVNLLIKIGTKRNVAKVLVFLASTKEATARAIERGTDMRQPEVSMVMKSLIEQGWINSRDIPPEHKGRPAKVYDLAKPIAVIMDTIAKDKMNEANNKLAFVSKLRDYID